MKKLIMAALTVALVLTVSCGMAESIFAPLPEEKTPAAQLTAPSYGKLANVEPDSVEENAEGGRIVTYNNVDTAGYNQFGVYLGSLGFSVADQEQRDNQIAYAVTNGQVSFVMIYDQAARTMQTIYPKGTDYEVSLFPGYTQVKPNDEITVSGLGSFVFGQLVLDGDGHVCGSAAVYEKGGKVSYYNEKGNSYHRGVKSWMEFSFYNIANTEKTFSQMGNDLFTAELVFLNQDNQYAFEMKEFGRFLTGKNIISTAPSHSPSTYDIIENRPCKPLDSLNGAVAFDLPDGLRTSAEGTIAVKLNFRTGEKYILMFRENGSSQGIAPLE